MGNVARKVALNHFSEVAAALLDAADKAGRWDDMTVLHLLDSPGPAGHTQAPPHRS